MSKNGLRFVETAFLFLSAMLSIGGSSRPANTPRSTDNGDGVDATFQQKGGQRLGVTAPNLDKHLVDWENAPRVDLVCRTYSGGLYTMWNIFFPSYLLFWPMREWKSSELVVVLDGESPSDHEQGTVLQHLALPSMVRVRYEARPPEGTLCSNWRREGYSRQQYSNFYADLYTDAEFLAIVDTDSAFQAPAVPSDLFENGKPIVMGFNQRSGWTSETTSRAIGGNRDVSSFMHVYSFPVVLRASDLPSLRAGIAENLGAATFDEAFHMICSAGAKSYSQFNIILNYMWYNMRDSYAWHLADPDSGTFDGARMDVANRATDDAAALSKNIPTVLLMRHRKGVDLTSIGPSEMFRNLCDGSDYQAGFCETLDPTTTDGVPITGEWTAGNVTWRDTYLEHLQKIAGARPAFDWRHDVPGDWTYPGGN
ncbi:unnamed protein product [Scytosiphon promiscuus]